jgi:hypothetical protein
MERSESWRRVGVDASALPDVAALLDRPGPFVSAFVDTGLRAAFQNRAQPEVRWRDHRRHLEERGAPALAIEAAEAAFAQARGNAPSLAIFADGEGRWIAVHGPETDADDVVVWDTLPRLAPIVSWYQDDPPSIVALVDRTGADLVVLAHGGSHHEEAQPGSADDPEIRRSAPGGWSQRRYQQRAENRWRANAEEVGSRLEALTAEIDPRLIVVAGDVRAVQLLLDGLPGGVRSLVSVVDGSRGAGGGDHVDEEVRRLRATAVAEDTVALIERLKEEVGQRDKGVTGVDATLEALTMGAVDTLLVHDDTGDERRAFVGQNLSLVSRDREVVAAGSSQVREARLVDALVAAAWSTGAAVRVVPMLATLTDGVGALLRFPAPVDR